MNVGRQTLFGFCLILGICTISWEVGSTILLPRSVEQLKRDSSVVVVGIPTTRSSYWVGGKIMTTTWIRVLEIWKGGLKSELVAVETRGGIVEDLGQVVSGEAKLKADAVYVLFLTQLGKELWGVTGMSEGVYEVHDWVDANLESPVIMDVEGRGMIQQGRR